MEIERRCETASAHCMNDGRSTRLFGGEDLKGPSSPNSASRVWRGLFPNPIRKGLLFVICQGQSCTMGDACVVVLHFLQLFVVCESSCNSESTRFARIGSKQ